MLSFTFSLRATDAGKFLTDTVLPACSDESVIAGSFKFGTVVGICAVDLIRALGDDRAYEKVSSAVLGFIGENIGIQIFGEIIDSHEQIFARSLTNCPLSK